jgi:hypothetical protein
LDICWDLIAWPIDKLAFIIWHMSHYTPLGTPISLIPATATISMIT